MKKILFVIIVCFMSVSFTYGQFKDVKDFRKGPKLGVGYSMHYYYTSWTYQYMDGGVYNTNNPYHSFSRQGIFVDFESRSMFELSIIHFDFGFDVFFGFAGDTKEEWLENNDVISSGGGTYGIGLQFKIAVPFLLTDNFALTPYTGIGVQGSSFQSNGEDVAANINPNYRYDDAWVEGVVGASMPFGLEIELTKFVFSFEYMFMLGGTSFSDWDPKGEDVEKNDSPDMGITSFGIGIKL